MQTPFSKVKTGVNGTMLTFNDMQKYTIGRHKELNVFFNFAPIQNANVLYTMIV